MVTVDILFPGAGSDHTDSICCLAAAWLKNGQVYSWHTGLTESGVRVVASIPEEDALSPEFNNQYAARELGKLAECGTTPVVSIIGRDPDEATACACIQRSSLILFTTYLSEASPVRCGDCFHPVPLYRLPHTRDHEHLELLQWAADYRACDTLQMHCTTGERFGETQMSASNSALSRGGRRIAAKLSELTGVPVYYFLYKARGVSGNTERKRTCPDCRGAWLLPERWHEMFWFRCDACSLVSTIARSLRS